MKHRLLPDTLFANERPSIKLPTLSMGHNRVYVSFPFEDGAPVAVHHLAPAPGWTAGPVRCTGANCPACRAGRTKTTYQIIPAFDWVASKAVVLRVPASKGPRALATELDKVLTHPDRHELVARITHMGRHQYKVDAIHVGPPDAEKAQVFQSVRDQLDAREIDLTAGIGDVSSSQLADHPHIASTLRLEALAQ